jgi:DNA polymerase-3 subunit alpha
LIRVGAFDLIDANRGSLLASVGMAIESAEQMNQSSNQANLFAETSEALPKMQLIQTQAWSEREKLHQEKIGLGYYFSGHPYETYALELKRFIRTRLNQLNPQRETQLIAGIIHSIRIQMTRRGRMAVINLDDGNARVEIVVFNELFDVHRARLKEDQLLIVEVKISNRNYNSEGDDELRITAEQLYDLAQIRTRFAKQLKIHCNATTIGSIANLKDLLVLYAANVPVVESHNLSAACPVTLIYHNEFAVSPIEFGKNWQVILHNDLLQALYARFKMENVEIVY